MADFLKENLIGILGLILAVVVPLFIYLKGTNRKELSYDIGSPTSLIMNDLGIRKKLKITFDDEAIEGDVFLVLIRIVNTGNVPIIAKDFTEDLTINTAGNVLVAEVEKSSPPNINVKINNDLGVIGLTGISPLLLNSKDEIVIKLLIQPHAKDFSKNNISVGARIVGVKEIIKFKEKLPLKLLSFFLGALGLSLILSKILNGMSLSNVLLGLSLGALLSLIVDRLKSK